MQAEHPPAAPTAPHAAVGASLVSSQFPVLPPSGTIPGATHFPEQSAQGYPRFSRGGSAAPVCSKGLFCTPGAFHTAAAEGRAGLVLPLGKLRQESASSSTPAWLPRGSAHRDLPFGTNPAKPPAASRGCKFRPRIPSAPKKRGGRRETSVSFAMHISARVVVNISGGGGCVVFHRQIRKT